MTNQPQTLWRDALLITMDDQHRSRPFRGDLLVDGAGIVAVAASSDGGLAVPEGGKCRVIDGRQLMLVPGLVNAHTHSWESLLRGTSEAMPLEVWTLETYPLFGVPPVPDRLVYLRTLVAGMDALRGGTTNVLDDVGELPVQGPAQLAAVFDAYERLGIRANVSGGVVDVAPVDRLPFASEFLEKGDIAASRAALLPSASIIRSFLDASADAFRLHHGRAGDRLRYVVAPSAPQRCTDELLLAADDLSAAHGAVLHTHLLETKMQAVVGAKRYGTSIVEHLDKLGLLSDRLTVAHAIWLTDADIHLLGSSSATIVHNPLSNLKLGSGLLRWRALLDAGATLALGTDGTASNDSLRMLDVIKQAALLHTLTDPDFATWPSTDEVLWAATRGGAEATGRAAETGSLEPGKRADLVVFDLTATSNFTPLNDAARQLVFSEDGRSIAEVWVDGELVVDHGRIVRVDETAVLAEFRELATAYLPAFESARAANRIYVPAIGAIHRRAAGTTHPATSPSTPERTTP
ncbi:MAG: amidohydrolase [Glaciihabitans sp.]|nr:amidohydrolase [Glaciihabitans sp.]